MVGQAHRTISLAPQPRTWLLCGIPRSGTSLCCRLAGRLPDVVALSEPIGRQLSGAVEGAEAACALIDRFVGQTRTRILAEGRAPTVHVDGRLDDDRVGHRLDGGLREPRGQHGEIVVDRVSSPGFTLLIKHNALFAALLEQLARQYACLAVIRNPLAVLASWNTVDLPVGRGRIPAGEQFDARLKTDLDGASDVLVRQIVILNWFYARFRAHVPAERIVRYEQLVATGGATLFRALGFERGPTEPLASRNDNAAYAALDAARLVDALLAAGGEWSCFYSESDCLAAADAMRARA